MSKIIRIGIDTSKTVFVLHGVDAAEQPVLRRKLRRSQMLEFFRRLEPTKIGIEACGAAHYWQADLMLAGVRDAQMRRRTQLSNMIRGYAAEFGLTVAKGLDKIEPLLVRIAAEATVPRLAKELFAVLGKDYARLQRDIAKIEARLMAWHKNNELSRRLVEIPGVGPIGATLAVMKVTDPHEFLCGRAFSAWIGLTPKDHSTAGKTRLGVITRAGDEELRRVLVAGATSVIKQARAGKAHASPWLLELCKRKPPKLAAIALANKNARIIWKLMVSGERYEPGRELRVARPGEGRVAARRVAARRGGSAPRPSPASRVMSREVAAMTGA